jgi:hypothetical protein
MNDERDREEEQQRPPKPPVRKANVPLRPAGETVVPMGETAPPSPPGKHIQPRRPLPPVPEAGSGRDATGEDSDEAGDAVP